MISNKAINVSIIIIRLKTKYSLPLFQIFINQNQKQV